jgi:hypothetical protein
MHSLVENYQLLNYDRPWTYTKQEVSMDVGKVGGGKHAIPLDTCMEQPRCWGTVC